MKTIALPTFFALGILSFALSASAQGMMGPSMMGGLQGAGGQASAAVMSALEEIYQDQNTSAQSGVDCASITEDQLESLGDAYMESIHPGAAHEYMDQMMGGEGSESLRQAHIAMGRAYLGCWSGERGDGFALPMMGGYGGSMMGGYGAYHGIGMMGGSAGFGYGWLGTLTMLVWLAAGILLVLVLIRR
ncbi:MAG: hypothetical protein U1D26_00445, partial [Patescibacteria group bacterium]|nr:hypothetical protein [Patescibacteria group bacterium]